MKHVLGGGGVKKKKKWLAALHYTGPFRVAGAVKLVLGKVEHQNFCVSKSWQPFSRNIDTCVLKNWAVVTCACMQTCKKRMKESTDGVITKLRQIAVDLQVSYKSQKDVRANIRQSLNTKAYRIISATCRQPV